MDEPRFFDMDDPCFFSVARLIDIFMRLIKTEGEIRVHQSLAGITVSLTRREFPRVDMSLSTEAIDMLAEHLRVITAVDVSANAEAFTRVLAQIALVVNHVGPQVASVPANDREIISFVHRIYTEFAVACATEFAQFHDYAVDQRRIPRGETSVALLVNDEDLVAWIFHESLHITSSTEGSGRHARPSDPQYNAELDAEAFIRPEGWLVDGNPISDPASKDTERHLTAASYSGLRFFAEIEDWNAYAVLLIIDEYLSPYGAEQSVDVLISYLEGWLATASPSGLAPRGADRHLTAESYWNLRSVAEIKGWSAEIVLALIDEHLNPTLRPDLVHYHNNVSGLDWQRLHMWMFGSDGSM